MKNARVTRQITMLTLVVALGAAIYLNWEYAKNDPTLDLTQAPQNTTEVSAATDDVTVMEDQQVTTTAQDLLLEEGEGNKNYGDAQLVSATQSKASEYFEKAQLTRKKSRDEALDKLQKSLKNAKLSQEEKDKITTQLTQVLTGITAEGDIENMILAKGFANCIVNVSGEKVNVAVSVDGAELSADKVAQIRDVVLSKYETEAKNITIVEVK